MKGLKWGAANLSQMANCPQCGTALGSDDPAGLCPKCLMEGVFESSLGGNDSGIETVDTVTAGVSDDDFGRYHILRPLGEGGMGTVYLAEQREPIRRTVALKVVKLGMDTNEVLTRFNHERQALAMMDHPNIACIFDAGATAKGRPYFVMEYIEGVPITQYCDSKRMTIGDRLELFLAVCRAVQHAHQKGVIHRDLKPSNVLVMDQESAPVPKVIDFGIAKATDQWAVEKTLLTQFGQMVGTPEYASPEQAEVMTGEVDERSDVYSLGVILYELLIGVVPFDPTKLRQEGLAEMLRIVREEEAPPLSRKLSAMGVAAAEIASHRQTDPTSLHRLVDGDLDAAWAASRDRNEHLVEIKQIKGQSETHPLLSPNDEFANYEVLSYLLGNPDGRFDHIVGSFARQALKDGLTMQDTQGYNPYKFGMVGGSDSHNTGVAYRQNNFYGGHAHLDGTIETRMSGHLFAGLDVRLENPAGITGVWAEENTRASIFDAMQRKETFGASGPHIKVRFFGGWNYEPAMLNNRDWVKSAYASGVPMGGDLPPTKGKAPTFVVWAVKDPTSGNLDRVQIIKGWSKSGQSFEKIFDVVWSGDRKPNKWTGKIPPIQSTVDVENATYTNTVGSVELKTVWTDPEFDPSLHAFYYARVLEIPTPRWTTIQAHQLGIAPPDVVSATVQERAWSSPIWYTPGADARKESGMTVAALQQKGGTALDDAALKALIVGKAIWVRNTVTGDQFKVVYTQGGQSVVYHVGRSMDLPSEVGNLVQTGYQGISTAYSIQNGKIVTSLAETPFEVAVYKVGDTYYGARSNEFGYANYQILPKAPINLLNLNKGESHQEEKGPPPGTAD